LLHLSALLLRVGRATDALVPADEARTRHPTNPRGWIAVGRAAVALGRTTEAEDALRKAIGLGAVAEGSLELAKILHSLGRNEDALAVLGKFEAPDAEASLLRSDIHEALGRMEEALADCDAAIRTAVEGRDLAYRRKGVLLLALQRSKEALAAFDAALGLNPTDAEAWLDAARAWKVLGQGTRARKMLDHALRLDPEHAEARRLRSEKALLDLFSSF
ncbi:MAG: tetratricopeptide repeat protein, partial [Thermoplasmata archaeon]